MYAVGCPFWAREDSSVAVQYIIFFKLRRRTAKAICKSAEGEVTVVLADCLVRCVLTSQGDGS